MSDNLKLSFEFFPPKTQLGVENLKNTRDVLAKYDPEFYSVTFGAAGSSQDHTLTAVSDIQQESSISAAPHISCIGTTKDSIAQLLNTYQQLGISRLVVLRGDEVDGQASYGDFNYASELVEFIRNKTGNHFSIAVAAYPEMHPESKDLLSDFEHFKNKMSAGADFAITQYFYNSDGFLRFRDLCSDHGINQPILPGIMPISNFSNLSRFSKICGAEIPRWIRKSLESFELNSSDQLKLGYEIVLDLINRLHSESVEGFHFYSMNKHNNLTQLIDNAELINS